MGWLATTLASLPLLAPAPGPQADGRSEATVELLVASDGSGAHTSIQDAVDAAPAGAVVRIGPGTYAERVRIARPLTLQGSGWEETILVAPYENPLEKDPTLWAEAMARATTPEARREASERLRREHAPLPTLCVEDTSGVQIRDLKIGQPGDRKEGIVLPGSAVSIVDAGVWIEGCAVLGSPACGITISGQSDVVVRASLVAGIGATGIQVGNANAVRAPRVAIEDCEVRNCVHRGITIGNNRGARVERCRISGSSWHGIRYDAVGPTIRDNLIFDNARSGIYASGATSALVTGNVFYRNRFNGISCWFENADRIEGNTFLGNLRSAIEVLGASHPAIHDNVFVEERQGVFLGDIAQGEHATSSGAVDLRDNVFWKVEQPTIHAGQPLAISEADGNRVQDPGLSPPSLESPWASQPEEAGCGVPSPETARAVARDQEDRAASRDLAGPWIEDLTQIRDAERRLAAVESVRDAIASDDPLERLAGLTALVDTAEVGYERASFRPLVRPLVETETGWAHVQAFFALLSCGRSPGDCELVVEALKSPTPSLRENGSRLLTLACEGEISGAAATAMLELLAVEDARTQRLVLNGLWGVSAADEVQARLLEIAAGPSRYDAIYFALSTLQNKNERTVRLLIEALSDPDPNTHGRALWGLGHGVPPEQHELVAEALLDLFETRASAREEIVRTLSHYARAPQLPRMRELAGNELVGERLRAALGRAIEAVEARR